MTTLPVLYRLVIVDPTSANTFTPGDATVHNDHLWVTSSRDPAQHNYITTSGIPSDDGDRLDVLSSNVEEGACKIGVSDASAYVTNRLTNAAGRGQMIGSAAYCEVSNDGGTTWDLVRHGFVTDVELPRAQEFLFTIGGTRRRERNSPVSSILAGLDFSGIVFYPTAIIGGPIFSFPTSGGVPGYQPEYGLPLFIVRDVQVAPGSPDNLRWVRLRYVSGPMPPDYDGQRPAVSFKAPGHGPTVTAPFFQIVNAMAATYFDDTGSVSTIPNETTTIRGRFRGVNVMLFDPADPPTRLWDGLTAQALQGPTGSPNRLMGSANDVFVRGFSTVPAVNDTFLLAAVPNEMAEEYPLWYAGHPVEVAAAALSAIGASLNAASAIATQNALGRSLYTVGRLTDPAQTVSDWLNGEGAFWGYALVPGDDSTEFAILPTRDWPSVGAVTIDNDDLRDIGGPTYKVIGNSRRTALHAHVTQFILWHSEMDVDRPYSDLVPFEIPLRIDYEPAGTPTDDPKQVIEVAIGGTIATQCHLVQPVFFPPVAVQAADFVEAIAVRLFDRHGKGTPEYAVRVTGHSAPATYPLGSLLTLDTSHIPNALLAASPTSQRGGPRPVRIIARTTDPAGDDLTCIDEGDGVPYTGTFDIDDFVEGPTPDSAVVSISGLLALEADGATVTVYLTHLPAGSAGPPTDTGVPVITITGNGVDDVASDDIGPLPVNVDWWIRADAKVDGSGVSASTAWWSLGGSGTTPPSPPPQPTGNISALVVSDIGTDYAVLTWTNTNTTERIRVSYKLGTASVYTVVQIMPPTSISYTIFGLVPATAYDFQVEMISSSGTVWTTLTASDTTDAGTPSLVLYTPLNPRAYAGTGLLLGGCGLLVEPVFNTPHEVEFEMTPETAVGSGVPDAWPSDVTPAVDAETQYWPVTSANPGVNGSVDVFSLHNVPNDGRLRYFRARARKIQSDGSIIYSPWTDIYSVMPWTVVVPPPDPFAGLVDGGDAFSIDINSVDDGDAATFPAGPPLDGGNATSIP